MENNKTNLGEEILEYTHNGQTRHYTRTYQGAEEIESMEHRYRPSSIECLQFFSKIDDKYIKLTDYIPFKFFQFVWENIIGLDQFGTGLGNDRWYEVCDFLSDENQEPVERAWLLYTLEGNGEKLKRLPKTIKKKSMPKHR